MRAVLAWLYVPVAILVLLALALGAFYAALPAIAAWYREDILRGIPAGVVVPFAMAAGIAWLTTRRPTS